MGLDARILITTTRKFTKEEILRKSCKMSMIFGHDNFYGERALSDESDYYKDYIESSEDGTVQILEVFLMGRYYGEGYARGYWPLQSKLLEYLISSEFEPKDCLEVYYGGDSYDSLKSMEIVDPQFFKERNELFFSSGNMTYRGGFGGEDKAICKDCPDIPIVFSVFGGGDKAGECPSCGKKYGIKDSALYLIKTEYAQNGFSLLENLKDSSKIEFIKSI